jgi:endoglucanase
MSLGETVRAEPGFVRVEGKRFVQANGETLSIKGINLGHWLMPEGYILKFKRAASPRQIEAVIERLLGRDGADDFWHRFRTTYIEEADIRFIKSVGFNTVRIPLHFKLFLTDGQPPEWRGEGFRLLDRVIGWARAAGLYVILDLHAAPGGQTGINHDDGPGYPMLFYVPAHRRATAALWQELAKRYRDEPAVLGYDLLNEPISPYHDVAYLNPRLEPAYKALVAAIRQVDPRHIIFLEGAQWSTGFSALGAPFAPNLAYTYHMFWSSTRRDAIQSNLNFRDRYNVPILLGESGELTDQWTQDFRRLHDQQGIGWVFWTYKNLDSGSTVVSVPLPPDWDLVTDYANRPPSEWREPGPERQQKITQSLARYLDAIRLSNGKINWSYLEALGLGPNGPRK